MDTRTSLREATRRFLTEQVPPGEVRRLMGAPADRVLWSRLAELGLPGLLVPAEHGGAGLGFAELAVVLEETGRTLLPAPILGTALATAALLRAGHEAPLRGIAAGHTLATVALHSDVSADGGVLRGAALHGAALHGVADHVPDGESADLVVVATATGLFLATPDHRLAHTTLDQTRPLARLTFAASPAIRLGGLDAVAHLRDLAAVALAAEQVGGAAHCLDAAVAYAKTRVQFGRPIGSFQAIKHRCADLLLAVESARSAAYHAAQLAADASPELPVYAALAGAHCAEVYTAVAAENIQIHGGIGVTWEHDAHLYLKRAKTSEVLFDPPARHRARLATLTGMTTS